MLVLDEAAGVIDGTRVLMLSGSGDPIVPAASADRLAAQLAAGGAVVEHRRMAAAHGLVREDIALAQDWLSRGTDGAV